MSIDHLPYLLKRTYFAMRQAIDDALKPYSITSAQLEVLVRVGSSDCTEHRALLDSMDIASPTLTRLVDGMVESGLLERVTSKADARVKVLSLTQQGQALRDNLQCQKMDFTDLFFAGFSDDEKRLFADLIDRILTNIEGLKKA